MESGQRRDKMLARISHTAEETGYVVDLATLEVSAVEYDEVGDVPPSTGTGIRPGGGSREEGRVICVECGEEVSEAQVNEAGVCSVCTMPINEPATAAML